MYLIGLNVGTSNLEVDKSFVLNSLSAEKNVFSWRDNQIAEEQFNALY